MKQRFEDVEMEEINFTTDVIQTSNVDNEGWDPVVKADLM